MKPFDGFIFLCGGPTHIPDQSFRNFLITSIIKEHNDLDGRIITPEEFKDWSNDGLYRDLATFERHIADISSLIIIILESAGSLVEFGLYSLISDYEDKILVIIDTSYGDDSFIRLGPAKYLENIETATTKVVYYDFQKDGVFCKEKSQLIKELVVNDVLEKITATEKTRKFNQEKWLDCTMLIFEFLVLFRALTISEIRQKLHSLKITKKDVEIKQHLFILGKLELVKIKSNGGSHYYIPQKEEKTYIDLKISPKVDLDRFKVDKLMEYRNTDKKRFLAITRGT